MNPKKTFDQYYNFAGDEKSKVGVCESINPDVDVSFFWEKTEPVEIEEPFIFKIVKGRFSGTFGDYQFNNCGFWLFSDRVRAIMEKYLTNIDLPKWYPAKVIDLEGNVRNYHVLHFFGCKDLLDYQNSTFIEGTDSPIKKRYDLDKIGDRLIFSTIQSVYSSICVHDIVRKEIKEAGCTGIYFYKMHTAGRLS